MGGWVRDRRRPQASSGCASGLEHSVDAGFDSALLYKISALCLLKAFAHARVMARIPLQQEQSSILNQMLGIPAGLAGDL
jgi:hypothetical protein